MNAFVLDNPDCIPKDICGKLSPFEDQAKKYNSMDDLLQVSGFRVIAELLDQQIQEGRVHVYHCTNHPNPDLFKKNGLHTLNFTEHLTNTCDLIKASTEPKKSAKIIECIQKYYKKWNEPDQPAIREGNIGFCMSRHFIENNFDEVWRFFKYFGGEAVYWNIPNKDNVCLKVLENIGEPVVVVADLPTNDLFNPVATLAFAKDILSHWAARLNSNFEIKWVGANYINRNVTPEEIIAVHDAKKICPDAFKQVGGR